MTMTRAFIRERRMRLGSFLVIVAIAGIAAALMLSMPRDETQAFHSGGAELWGYVKNSSGSAVSGAEVWYCYDRTVTPPPDCTGFAPTSGVSDAKGKWWYLTPPAGYYRIWAAYNCAAYVCESYAPDQTFSYSGSGMMQVPDLVLVSSAPATRYALTININGGGNVYYSPPGANCGFAGAAPPCSLSYASGASVTLTVQSNTSTGSTFTGWSGDCSGTNATCTLTMNAEKSVTANFSSGTTEANKIYGYVKDANGQYVNGANVRYCTSTTPEPFPSCFSTLVQYTGTDGKWVLPNPSTNLYYRFWVDVTGTTYGPSNTLNAYYSGGALYAGDILLSSGQTTDSGPNLRVERLGYSSPSVAGPQAGDVIGFFGDVWNRGNTSAGSSMTRFRLDVGSDGSWDITPSDASTGALAAGAMETERWDSLWTAIAGSHTFQICADRTAAVVESDENDNCATMTFTVGATAATNEMWGYVKDASGVAVSGAAVKYLWDATKLPTAGTPSFASYSDTTGRWSFVSPASGYYRFWAVSPQGVASPYRDFYYGGTGKMQLPDLIVSGAATGSLFGHVYSPQGVAVSGATIEARQESGTVFKSAVSDASGYFSISDLPVGQSYRISARPPQGTDYAEPPSQFVWLSAEFPSIHVNIQFLAKTGSATIAGRVTDGSGVGIPAVYVNAAMAEGGGYARTQTASDGTYRLSVTAGTWEVSVYPDPMSGYMGVDPPSRRIAIAEGQIIGDANFTLRRGDATISGRVLDANGNLLSTLSHAWVFTEGGPLGGPVMAGLFRFPVPAGIYNVNIWLPPESGYMSRGAVSVSVAAGQVASVDLSVTSTAAGGKFEGALLDGSGNRVTNVSVRVFAGSRNGWFPGTVDFATGRYTVNVPPGTWQLGYAIEDPRYARGGPVGEPVTVTAGQVVSRNIILLRADATIRIDVRKPDGSPFPAIGVEVTTTPFSPETTSSMTGIHEGAMTDTFGKATIAVPAGTYYVRSFAPVGAGYINPPEQSVVVAAGESKTVTLQFRLRSATISGRVLVNGQAVADAFVGGWSKSGGFAETRSARDGTFSLSVASGDIWNLKAGANVQGIFYESAPVQVDMTTRTAASADIIVGATPFAIPPPLARTYEATQPVSASLQNGTQLSCSANCFLAQGMVNITIEPDIAAPDQGGVRVIGAAYKFEARTSDGSLVTRLGSRAVIAIPYDAALVQAKGVAEADLALGFFDEASGRWQIVKTSTVDPVAKLVTGTSDHLTRFAIVTPAYATIVPVQIREGDLIRGPDRIKVYIVNAHGYKRHIFNPAIFGMYKHFTWESIKDVSQSVLDSYATSDLYRADSDPKVYSLVEIDEAAGRATKHWLDMTPARFTQLGYDWKQIFIVNAQERDYYVTGPAIQ